jgi:membrane protein YqaA with SNARE-associated domain
MARKLTPIILLAYGLQIIGFYFCLLDRHFKYSFFIGMFFVLIGGGLYMMEVKKRLKDLPRRDDPE